MRAASLWPRCLALMLLAAVCGASTLALAQAPSFDSDAITLESAPRVARVEPPFEGVISKESAFVRSGPSEDDYYPTTKLQKGARVKVVREDFGWYLIEPPAGSHSWVNAEHVERRAGNRGIVTTDTFDRIGTDLELPQQVDEVRHRLGKRETVEIIDEADLDTPRGKVRMLKIKPPRGEYRYIHKNDVSPLPSGSKSRDLQLTDRKPGAENGERKSISLKDEKPIGDLLPTTDAEGVPTPKVAEPTPTKTVVEAKSKPAEAVAQKEFEIPAGHIDANVRLKQIDDEFKQMAEKPAAQWNLASVRDQYIELRDQLQNAGSNEDAAEFQKELDKRLAAVGRYQTRYNDFLAVQQIMRDTEVRDEQIRQQFLQGRQSVATQVPVTTHVSRSNGQPTLPQTDPFAQPSAPTQPMPQRQQPGIQQPPQWPQRPMTNAATPNAVPNWGATQQPRPNRPMPQPNQPFVQAPFSGGAGLMPSPMMPRKFDGAGIVQRAAASRPGAPQYVLLAPDGRVLTYLQAGPGVNLEQFVGRPMGLLGQRGFRPELNADLLVVQQATPVRLKTGQ